MDRAQYEEWRHHPATKEVFRFLADFRQEILERWAAGQFSHPTMEASMLAQASAISKAQCLEEVTSLEFEFIRDFYSKEGAQAE